MSAKTENTTLRPIAAIASMLCILIAGCTGKQQAPTATTDEDSLIIASSPHPLLETGMDCCYLNTNGDTIVPYGKYRYAGSDTIKHIGFVLDTTGYATINNKGERLFAVFTIDNGPDYVQEGLFRIIDDKGLVSNSNIIANPPPIHMTASNKCAIFSTLIPFPFSFFILFRI